MEKYNGWTNFETWKISLEFSDVIESYLDDLQGQGISDYDKGQQLKNYIEEMIFEGFDSVDLPFSSLFSDGVHYILHAVNWVEIANHYPEPENEVENE